MVLVVITVLWQYLSHILSLWNLCIDQPMLTITHTMWKSKQFNIAVRISPQSSCLQWNTWQYLWLNLLLHCIQINCNGDCYTRSIICSITVHQLLIQQHISVICYNRGCIFCIYRIYIISKYATFHFCVIGIVSP